MGTHTTLTQTEKDSNVILKPNPDAVLVVQAINNSTNAKDIELTLSSRKGPMSLKAFLIDNENKLTEIALVTRNNGT